MNKPLDRLSYTAKACRGKRVLDVGGALMPETPKDCRFAKAYSKIKQGSKEYKVMDRQNTFDVDYVADLNTLKGIGLLSKTINEYQPEIILCMETLEHINCHWEVMEVFAEAISKLNCVILISLPNDTNLLFKYFDFDWDHLMGFNKETATRFLTRSSLGKHHIKYMPLASGMYQKYWPLCWLFSVGNPIALLFQIKKEAT